MKKTYDLETHILTTKYLTKTALVVTGITVLCICTTILMVLSTTYSDQKNLIANDSCKNYVQSEKIIKEYFHKRQFQKEKLSKLGQILFTNEEYPQPRNKTYKILIWKEGQALEKRHIYHYSKTKFDPFENCSVSNCNLTYESDDIQDADAVVFSLQKFEGNAYLPDLNEARPENQRWIFLTDQSPFNTFRFRELNDWKNLSDIFNWSMSYKMDSDVPVPYGRIMPITNFEHDPCDERNDKYIQELIPNFKDKRRDVLVAIKTADCGKKKKRVQYLEELRNYIDVDIYGRCSNDSKKYCSNMASVDCPELNEYLFYLSFENSNCDQFITEDLFWMGFYKGAIPIVMGPSQLNCELLLPPNSFIHTKKYPDPKVLAEYLLYLNSTLDWQFFDYHIWRERFVALNEHGYYGSSSVHYCRVCEALNYNDESGKIYEDLSPFLGIENNCKD